MSKHNAVKKDKANATDKVAKAIREQITKATANYTVSELWQLLEIVNTKSVKSEITTCGIPANNPIPTTARLRSKVEYVSVDNESAAALIYSYLLSVENNKADSRNLVKIHKAFNGNVANPTHANRRLLYSYFFANECSLTNSIPAKVAAAYSKQPSSLDKVQREFVDNYLDNHPEFAATLRSYKEAHYLRAVVAG